MHFHIEDTNVLHSYTIAGVCTLHKEDLSESLEAQEQRGLVANTLGTTRPFSPKIRPRFVSFDRSFGARLHRMSAAT
jgi:hypothetical protein